MDATETQTPQAVRLEAVRDGYARGWTFTPLSGKRPRLNGWQQAPRGPLDQAEGWAAEGNVGLRTGAASGGLVVVDLDVNKPAFDPEATKALELPKDTPTVRTGSGGWHLYYRLPEGVESCPNSSGKLAAAVDVKADGGQVVFVGSIHPETGEPYRWREGYSPAHVELAELPGHLVERLRSKVRGPRAEEKQDNAPGTGRPPAEDRTSRYVSRAMAEEYEALSRCAAGGRGTQLNKSAFALGQLVGGGLLPREKAKATLEAACAVNGLVDTDGRRDVEYHIRKSLEAGIAEPRDVPPPSRPPAQRGRSREGGTVSSPAPAEEIELGGVDPDSGKRVLSTRRTLPTAEAFLADQYQHPDGRTLHAHAGRLVAWRGNRYVGIEDGELRGQLARWLHDALARQAQGARPPELVPFPSNPSTVNAALETVRSDCHIPADRDAPFWLDGRDPDGCEPLNVLPHAAGNLYIPTGRQDPPTPAFFTYNALEFVHDPDAPEPERWLSFLAELWPDDPGAIELLQEWFGYCLTADTSQQKMLLLVGPKRSGKGTIGRVLTELVGRDNVCGPTTESLGETFGLQQLLGKSLAIVSDARFAGPSMKTVVERLLCISGEDRLTVRRMYQEHMTVKLHSRFVFLTNELPNLRDAAGALAGRFEILTLQRTFFGREDPSLTDQLLAELPGILNWALVGWERLNERGRFASPRSSEDAADMLGDITSPVGAFVRECCEEIPGERVYLDELYRAWTSWCEAEGRHRRQTRQSFGRDLRSVLPHLTTRRHRQLGRFYEGLRLQLGALPDASAPAVADPDVHRDGWEPYDGPQPFQSADKAAGATGAR